MVAGRRRPRGSGRRWSTARPRAEAAAAAVAAAAPAKLVVVAERAAWVRVYLDNGTIIFERILEKGETYTPPDGIDAPLIWAGNAGSVYVRVGGELHGPLGSGTKAAKGVVLAPAGDRRAASRWWRRCRR